MKTYFISGHRDITQDEFIDNYAREIYRAAIEGDKFVVGDYEGADMYALALLWAIGISRKVDVTVYHMGDKPKFPEKCNDFPWMGGFKTDEERDAAMTAISDEDIAWVREGKEDSGTAINLRRRKAKL